jgi:hypothetical protein
VIYVKSLLAGLAALIVIAALIIGMFFFAPIVMERLTPPGVGVEYFVSPYFSMWPVLIGALFIFAVLSYLAFKRASRAPGTKI